jgi:hypothetical protein
MLLWKVSLHGFNCPAFHPPRLATCFQNLNQYIYHLLSQLKPLLLVYSMFISVPDHSQFLFQDFMKFIQWSWENLSQGICVLCSPSKLNNTQSSCTYNIRTESGVTGSFLASLTLKSDSQILEAESSSLKNSQHVKHKQINIRVCVRIKTTAYDVVFCHLTICLPHSTIQIETALLRLAIYVYKLSFPLKYLEAALLYLQTYWFLPLEVLQSKFRTQFAWMSLDWEYTILSFCPGRCIRISSAGGEKRPLTPLSNNSASMQVSKKTPRASIP